MFELLLRIGFSLIVVFALMWGLAKVVRRPLAGRGGELLSVVGRQQLTRNSSVAVVRVADRALIVGVTDNQVTLLGEADLAALEAHEPAQPITRSPIHLVPGAPTGIATEVPTAEHVPGLGAVRPAAPAPAGKLTGSLLSPQTWTETVNFLRERTVRK